MHQLEATGVPPFAPLEVQLIYSAYWEEHLQTRALGAVHKPFRAEILALSILQLTLLAFTPTQWQALRLVRMQLQRLLLHSTLLLQLQLLIQVRHSVPTKSALKL